jgi:hypothetical protein
VTTWQALSGPQRSALCGGGVALPGCGRPVEEHSNKRSYLDIYQRRWRC